MVNMSKVDTLGLGGNKREFVIFSLSRLPGFSN